MPCNMAGKHASIGCCRARIDHGQPRTGQRVHPPFAQDQRVGVPATDHDQILGQGDIAAVHGAFLHVVETVLACWT
jgi:hypothetical protein